MADNKKYYYLKLKENFFDSDSMVLLESIKYRKKCGQPMFIQSELRPRMYFL